MTCDFHSPGCFVDAIDNTPGMPRFGILAGKCQWAGAIVLCSTEIGLCKPVDNDHICARNPFVDDETATEDQQRTYLDDDIQPNPNSEATGRDADEAVENGATDRTRATLVEFGAHDDMDGDDTNVDDVYPTTAIFTDLGDDFTRADDDLDFVEAGDDRVDSPLFVTSHPEVVDLDSVAPSISASTDRAAADALTLNSAVAKKVASQPCGNLRGTASERVAARPVEDFFVLSATNALQSFLRGAAGSYQ